MKVLGLILELNPFHNGHKYFIDKAKEEIKPDLTVAVVSSSFTMRGEISILDKFTKCDCCLKNGIDIVLELPLLFSLQSSDFFAKNAVKILNSIGVTDIAFGTELSSINDLYEIKTITEQEKYQISLKNNINKGISYSASSLKAFQEISKNSELIANFSLPNNTLALSYLKAIEIINPNIIPHSITRINNNFYDLQLNESNIQSASSLRKLVSNNESINAFIPNYDYTFLNEEKINNEIFKLLKYKLLLNNDFSNIMLIDEGIENRIMSFIDKSSNYNEFINNVLTKRYSLNKIKRIIIHILLDSPKQLQTEEYLRVLGLNNKGMAYIRKLNNNSIIMNTKDELDKNNQILIHELKATKLYDLLTNKNIYQEEYKLRKE